MAIRRCEEHHPRSISVSGNFVVDTLTRNELSDVALRSLLVNVPGLSQRWSPTGIQRQLKFDRGSNGIKAGVTVAKIDHGPEQSAVI
jgi:hypothetical protein